jgi:transposase-like protein
MSSTNQEKIKQAVDLLIDKDTDLTSFFAKDGMLKELTKNLFERALKAEMEEHLGYSKYGRAETENSRNGVGKKSLITEGGVLELEVPRDRYNTLKEDLSTCEEDSSTHNLITFDMFVNLFLFGGSPDFY